MTSPEIIACPLQIEERAQHPGMVWIPGGTFEMGGDVYPEEGPRRVVSVEGFWMDRTEVTNADFAIFAKATNYVTVAERSTNPGAAVFVMPSGDADLSTAAAWWSYVKGANWKHPGGPDTSIEGRDHFPVTALAYEDVRLTKWKGRDLPRRRNGNGLPALANPNDHPTEGPTPGKASSRSSTRPKTASKASPPLVASNRTRTVSTT
jgi:hypothetical protein